MAQPKTTKVFVENIGGFSQKSLKQLKKAFAPSLESLFEARKKTEESSEGKAKKTSVGLLGLLLKPLKKLVVVLDYWPCY